MKHTKKKYREHLKEQSYEELKIILDELGKERMRQELDRSRRVKVEGTIIRLDLIKLKMRYVILEIAHRDNERMGVEDGRDS